MKLGVKPVISRRESFSKFTLRGKPMRTLKLAVKSQRWDLAAHTIVLATARQLTNGREKDAKERKAKKGRSKE
jgi:hypothetical protein